MARRLVIPSGSKLKTRRFRLMDHGVVKRVRRLREHNRVIFGLVAWTGFEQDVVEYDRAARTAGRSSWNVSRMLRSLYDVFMGFSDVVPRLITFLGVGFALIGFVASLTLLVTFLITPPQAPGWGSMIVVLTLFFGATFLILGIMSEYLSRIYQDSARRPLYFIANDTAAPDGRRVR